MAVIAAVVGAVASTAGALTGLKIFATIAKVAGIVGTVASLVGGSGANKPPPIRGSVSQTIIEVEPPQPYVMGEGYFAGVRRHIAGYGPTTDGVPNPYLGEVIVYSGAGPVENTTPWVDMADASASGWYSGFLQTSGQLGLCPQPAAMIPGWAGLPGWSASSKLNGQAARLWNFRFDKEGKRFASGIPPHGDYGKWVKVYDPRKDSTFAGGSGAHRLGNEATYEWSENPALHAGTYSFGRYQNGKLTFGAGLPAEGIDWLAVADWANVCDANAWTLFGVIYEPGDRYNNLRDICAAGGGEPGWKRGVLTFNYSRPRVPLLTITDQHLLEPISVTAMRTWRERVNTVLPQFRSPDHKWEIVTAASVSVPTFVAEDGEVKQTTWPFNFVKKVKQATELAAYRMMDSRELAPINVVLGPTFRALRPGDCVRLQIAEAELDIDAVILGREFDVEAMQVSLTLTSETNAKHAYCLGRVGTPPPTPALGQTAAQRDAAAAAALSPAGYNASLISSSWISPDAGPPLSADQTTITVAAHTRFYSDKAVAIGAGAVSVLDDNITALTPSTEYFVYYDDEPRSGGAVIFKVSLSPTASVNSPSSPARHFIGTITTAAPGAGSSSGESSYPGYWDPSWTWGWG